MMMTYRGYTLVPLMDGVGNSQVSVFSRANFITKTMTFVDEQSAVTEARKVVDAILARQQFQTPHIGSSTAPLTARCEPRSSRVPPCARSKFGLVVQKRLIWQPVLRF